MKGLTVKYYIVFIVIMIILNTVGSAYADGNAVPLSFEENQWKYNEQGAVEFANNGIRISGYKPIAIFKESNLVKRLYEFKARMKLTDGGMNGFIIGMERDKGYPWENDNAAYTVEIKQKSISLIKYFRSNKKILFSAGNSGLLQNGEIYLKVGSTPNKTGVRIYFIAGNRTLIDCQDNDSPLITGFFGAYSFYGSENYLLPIKSNSVDTIATNKHIVGACSNYFQKSTLFICLFIAAVSIVFMMLPENIWARKRR